MKVGEFSDRADVAIVGPLGQAGQLQDFGEPGIESIFEEWGGFW